MHEYFCGPTSFYFNRIPPQVKACLPQFPSIESKNDRRSITADGLPSYWPQPPLHILSQGKSVTTRSRSIREHLCNSELPLDCFCTDDDLGVTYAGPLYTLLSLAPYVSIYKLAMAMYEFCGSFSVYNPGSELQKLIDPLVNQRLIWPGNWRQVRDHAGNPTSLWMRDPLASMQELERFAETTTGLRGNLAFRRALKLVTGVCASPLEVQASMLLGIPTRLGGENLGPFLNNEHIILSSPSRMLADQDSCYADLLFERTEAHGPIAVECQGHAVHDGTKRARTDSNRTLALKNMGIEVLPITFEQLKDARRFDVFAAQLARALKIRRRKPTPQVEAARLRLRDDLFEPWGTFIHP